jgi:hypothetical protein
LTEKPGATPSKTESSGTTWKFHGEQGIMEEIRTIFSHETPALRFTSADLIALGLFVLKYLLN